MTTYLIKKQTAEGLVPVETFKGDHNARLCELSRDGSLYMAEMVFSEERVGTTPVIVEKMSISFDELKLDPAPKPPAKKKTPTKK